MSESVRIYINRPGMTQTSCRGSSPVMRAVIIRTTQRQNRGLCSRRARSLHDQRRRVRLCIHIDCSYRLFSLTVEQCEFVPKGQSVNTESCCVVNGHLRENIWSKQPKPWCNCSWVLQHDNMQTHNFPLAPLDTRQIWQQATSFCFPKCNLVSGLKTQVSNVWEKYKCACTSCHENT